MPTLVAVGLHDPQTPVGCSEELARGIAGAELRVYAHSGHHPFVEERALVARDLAEFLRAPRSGARSVASARSRATQPGAQGAANGK